MKIAGLARQPRAERHRVAVARSAVSFVSVGASGATAGGGGGVAAGAAAATAAGGSQASPVPSWSPSPCAGLTAAGQLSLRVGDAVEVGVRVGHRGVAHLQRALDGGVGVHAAGLDHLAVQGRSRIDRVEERGLELRGGEAGRGLAHEGERGGDVRRGHRRAVHVRVHGGALGRDVVGDDVHAGRREVDADRAAVREARELVAVVGRGHADHVRRRVDARIRGRHLVVVADPVDAAVARGDDVQRVRVGLDRLALRASSRSCEARLALTIGTSMSPA